jgi:hypothetical protein
MEKISSVANIPQYMEMELRTDTVLQMEALHGLHDSLHYHGHSCFLFLPGKCYITAC